MAQEVPLGFVDTMCHQLGRVHYNYLRSVPAGTFAVGLFSAWYMLEQMDPCVLCDLLRR